MKIKHKWLRFDLPHKVCIKLIDQQHQEIFQLSEHLKDLCLAPNTSFLTIGETMCLLANIWRKHLLEEEWMCATSHLHTLLLHQEEHNAIRNQLDDIQARFLKTHPNECQLLGMEMALMVNKLEEHIEADRRLISQLQDA